MSGAETVERLLTALTARDLETVAAQLHPEIEAQGRRGPFRGVEDVVGWARPNDEGHLSRDSRSTSCARSATATWPPTPGASGSGRRTASSAPRTASAPCSSSATAAIYRWRQDVPVDHRRDRRRSRRSEATRSAGAIVPDIDRDDGAIATRGLGGEWTIAAGIGGRSAMA